MLFLGAIIPLVADGSFTTSSSIRYSDIPVASPHLTGSPPSTAAPASVATTLGYHHKSSNDLPEATASQYYTIQSSMTAYPNAMTTASSRLAHEIPHSTLGLLIGNATPILSSTSLQSIHESATATPEQSEGSNISSTRVIEVMKTSSPADVYGEDNGTDSSNLTRSVNASSLTNDQGVTGTAGPSTPELITTPALADTSVNVTTAPPPSVLEDATYKIIFIGNCSIVKSNKSIEKDFADQVVFRLYSNLGISKSRIRIRDVMCGSVAVEITIYNTTRDEDLDQLIEDLILDGQLIVFIDYDNKTLEFEADALEVISSPTWKSTVRPSSTDIVPGTLWKRRPRVLTGLHIALILLFSVIGGSIVMFGIGFVVYFCCTKGRSKSFDLAAESTPQTGSMEDFTLTKMERPKPVYTDAGIILQTDIDETQVKTPMVPGTSNGQSSYDGGTRALKATKTHNGYFPKAGGVGGGSGLSNGRPICRRGTPAPIKGIASRNDGSSERLVFTELSAHNLSGFDNPSFSSDEMLADEETRTDSPDPGAGWRTDGHYSSPPSTRGKRRGMAPIAKKSLAVQQEKRSASPRGRQKRAAPNIPDEGATAL